MLINSFIFKNKENIIKKEKNPSNYSASFHHRRHSHLPIIMSSRSRNSTLIQEYNFSFYIDKNNNNSSNNNNNNKAAKESQSNSQNQQHQHSQLQQTKPQSQSQIFHFHFRPTPTGTTGTASASHLTHSATTKTRPQSKGSRLHQILLTNQSSLNNIVFDTFSCDSNSSMSSYTRTPRTPRFTYNNEQSLSILVKKPFKHYVSSVKSAAISTISSSTSNLKKTKSNSNDAINTSSNFEATISNTKFNSGTNEVPFYIIFNFLLRHRLKK